MNTIFNNLVLRCNIFKLSLPLVLQRCFNVLLFLTFKKNIVLDIVISYIINISLTINIFKDQFFKYIKELSLTQLLRYFYYGLLLYFIFNSIMALVGICASLVDCLAVFPLHSGLEESVLQLNNNGTAGNYGFITPGGSNTPTPGTPGGGYPGIPCTHQTTTQIIHDDGS